MSPTHAVSADEARRLLAADRREMLRRLAREWFAAHRHEFSPYWDSLFTPFGSFTYGELTAK